VPHALIQHIVYHALVFKVPKTQDCKINYATVQYTAITMLYQHIKIANRVLLIPVRYVQTILHAILALVIKMKAILDYFPIVLVWLASILTHLSKLIVSVYYILVKIKNFQNYDMNFFCIFCYYYSKILFIVNLIIRYNIYGKSHIKS
jgi:hypothetical protein